MPTERTVLVRLKADVNQFQRAMREAADSVDKTNDRTAWLAQSILALGPAAVPLTASLVPALSTVATGATMAGAAVVSLGLAFNGVGDALKALNDYQLEPTEAHLVKMQQTMAAIGPEGADFVRMLDSLGPALTGLSNTARANIFPGMAEGLEDLMTLLPDFNILIGRTSAVIGDLSADAGESLAGENFREFFDYLETDGIQILRDMGVTLGKFGEGFANMLVAFGPLTRDFSTGLRGIATDFASWSHELDENQSFQDFLDYVQESGPKALDLFSSLVDVLVELAEAAAPVGDVALPALTNLLDIVAKLLDNPLAPWFIGAAAAMSVYGRAAALLSVTTGGMLKPFLEVEGGLIATTRAAKKATPTFADYANTAMYARTATDKLGKGAAESRQRVSQFAVAAGKGATAAALLGAQATGAAQAMGLANTATVGMIGAMVGKTGIGLAVGGVMDLTAALSESEESLRRQQELILARSGPTLESQLAGITAEIEKQQKIVDDAAFSIDLGFTTVSSNDDAARARDKLDAYKETQKNLRTEIEKTTAAQEYANSAMARSAAEATQQAAALRQVEAEAGDVGKQFMAFGDDLDDANVSLAEWTRNMRDQAIALEQFGANAEKAADRGLEHGLIEKLAEMGPEGARRMRELANGTDSAITAANRDFRRGEAAIESFKETMASIKAAEITVDDRKLRPGVNLIEQMLTTLTRPRSVKITTWAPGMGPVKLNNDGTTVDNDGNPNNHFADGGTVPGVRTPYGDKTLIWAAPGEQIISNRYGQADRFRADTAAGRIPGYADGGTVGGLKGYVTRDLDLKFPTTLRQWERALDKSREKIDEERAARTGLIDQRKQYGDTIAASLRTDPFGERPDGFQWMSGADRQKWLTQNPFDVQRGNLARGTAYEKALKALAGKGFDGAAFEALAATGDLERVQAYSGLSAAQLASYETLTNQANASTAAAGRYGAGVVYNPQINRTNAHMAVMVRQGASLEHKVEALEKAISRHGANGRASARATAASVRTR